MDGADLDVLRYVNLPAALFFPDPRSPDVASSGIEKSTAAYKLDEFILAKKTKRRIGLSLKTFNNVSYTRGVYEPFFNNLGTSKDVM